MTTTATETLTKEEILHILSRDLPEGVELIEVFMIDEDGDQSDTLTDSPVFDAVIDGQTWNDNDSTFKGVTSLVDTYTANQQSYWEACRY